jgi:hypothetical protein
MRCIHIDLKYEHFLGDYHGHPIKARRDVKTGEVLFDAESVAPILGFDSAEAMLSDEAVLAELNRQITNGKATPIRKL